MKKITLFVFVLFASLAFGITMSATKAKANMACGIPPIPPIGCTVGPCVCDQNGNNCQWTMICR